MAIIEYFLAGDYNRVLGRSNTTKGDVDGRKPWKLMRGQRNHLHEQWKVMQVLEFSEYDLHGRESWTMVTKLD